MQKPHPRSPRRQDLAPQLLPLGSCPHQATSLQPHRRSTISRNHSSCRNTCCSQRQSGTCPRPRRLCWPPRHRRKKRLRQLCWPLPHRRKERPSQHSRKEWPPLHRCKEWPRQHCRPLQLRRKERPRDCRQLRLLLTSPGDLRVKGATKGATNDSSRERTVLGATATRDECSLWSPPSGGWGR